MINANKVHSNDSKLMRVCVSKIKVRQVWPFNPVTRTVPPKVFTEHREVIASKTIQKEQECT